MKTYDCSLNSLTVLTEEEEASIEGGSIIWTWGYFGMVILAVQVITNPRAHYEAFLRGVDEGYNAMKNE